MLRQGVSCVASVANRLAITALCGNHAARPIQASSSLPVLLGQWIKPLARMFMKCAEKQAGTGHSQAVFKPATRSSDVRSRYDSICTETMLRGFDFLPKWIKEIEDFMRRHKYSSYRDFRDLAANSLVSADKLTIHDGYAEVDPEKCTGCGLCEKIGHCNAIVMQNGKSVIDKNKCLACSTCVDICPVGAIKMIETGIMETKNGKVNKKS